MFSLAPHSTMPTASVLCIVLHVCVYAAMPSQCRNPIIQISHGTITSRVEASSRRRKAAADTPTPLMRSHQILVLIRSSVSPSGRARSCAPTAPGTVPQAFIPSPECDPSHREIHRPPPSPPPPPSASSPLPTTRPTTPSIPGTAPTISRANTSLNRANASARPFRCMFDSCTTSTNSRV